jgi:hypothetical protein
MKIHEDLNFKRENCIYCKKKLSNSVKYISQPIDDCDGLQEVIFLDAHRVCSRRAMEIAFLENEIKLQEKNLVKLRRRLTALKTKEIIKCCEIGSTLN